MSVEWKCSCGWTTGEVDANLWQGAWSQAMRHQYRLHGNQTANDGNYMQGLFDMTTGEQITSGLSKKELPDYFGTDGRKPLGERADNRKKRPVKSQSTNTEEAPLSPKRKDTPVAKTNPSNIRGIVQGWQIPISAHHIAWFSLARKHITDNDGNAYTFTPEGFAKYYNDVFDHYHEERLPFIVFGRDGSQLLHDARAMSTMDKIFQTVSGMTPNRAEIEQLVTQMMGNPITEVASSVDEDG